MILQKNYELKIKISYRCTNNPLTLTSYITIFGRVKTWNQTLFPFDSVCCSNYCASSNMHSYHISVIQHLNETVLLWAHNPLICHFLHCFGLPRKLQKAFENQLQVWQWRIAYFKLDEHVRTLNNEHLNVKSFAITRVAIWTDHTKPWSNQLQISWTFNNQISFLFVTQILSWFSDQFQKFLHLSYLVLIRVRFVL